MWAEKKRKWPHEWLKGVLEVLGLATSTYIYKINRKVRKGYIRKMRSTLRLVKGGYISVVATGR